MSEFVEHLTEVFAGFGPIRPKRMFGGYGLFYDDLMIGLVADDVLYLKADDESAGWFSKKGLSQFEYVKQGKPMKMSYFMAPDEIFDDPEESRQNGKESERDSWTVHRSLSVTHTGFAGLIVLAARPRLPGLIQARITAC